MRRNLLIVSLLIFVSLFLFTVSISARGPYYRDGRVLDMTSTNGPGSDFVREFNQKSLASGHPIYLIIMGEEQLAGGKFTDEVGVDVMVGRVDPSLKVGEWLPYNVAVIFMAPYVGQDSSLYDYALPTLGYDGVYERLGDTALPGHEDFVGVEIAIVIDNVGFEQGWQKGALGGISEIANTCSQLQIGTVSPAQQEKDPEPTSVSQQPIVVIVPTTAPVPTPIPRESIDLTGLWVLFVSVLVLVALVVVYLILTRKQRSDRKRRTVQEKAIGAKRTASSMINELEYGTDATLGALVRVEARISSLQQSASDATLRPLRESYKAAKALHSDANIRFEELEHAYGDLDDFDSTAERYEQAGREYQAVVDKLKEAERLLNQIDAGAEEIEKAASQAPKALSAASETLSSARKQIAALAEEGFPCVEAEKMLELANANLHKAEQEIGVKHFLAAMNFAQDAKDLSEQAIKTAEAARERVLELKQEADAYTAEFTNLEEHIGLADQVLASMRAGFNSACWNEVKRNPQSARATLSEARRLLTEARAAIKQGRLKEADELLDQTHKAQQEAGWLVQSVIDRLGNLEESRKAAPHEIRASVTDIQSAWVYLGEHDQVVSEDLESKLERAEEKVAQAQQLLQVRQPDYLEAVRLAKEANGVVDQILASARNQVQRMARAKSSAETELREAKSACSNADSYIDDNRHDVGRRAKSNLEDAQRKLAEAEGQMEKAGRYGDGQEESRLRAYQRCAAAADKAEQLAKDALRRAKDDVSEARRPAEIDTTTTWTTPSTSHRRTSPTTTWPSPAPSRPSTPWSPSPSRSRPASRPSTPSPSVSRPASRPSSPSPTTSRPSGRRRR